MKKTPQSWKYPYVLTKLFAMLSVSLFLLFPGLGGYYHIQDEKAICFYVIFGGYLGLMLLFTLEMAMMGHIKLATPAALWRKASVVQKAAVMYFIFTLISALLSPNRAQTWLGMSRYEGALTIAIYCGCFLCVSAFAPEGEQIAEIFGVAMTVFCVICLLQMHGYNPLWLYPDGLTYFDANVAYPGIYLGTIGNADYVAAVVCMAAALFGVSAMRGTGIRQRLLLIPFVLCVAVLLKMQVQAGILAIVCGGLLSLAVVIPGSVRRRWICLAVVLVLAAAGLTAVLVLPMQGTLYELQQVLKGNWNENFGSGRIYIWKQVLRLIPDRPLFGAGPDTMMAAQIPGYDFIAPDGYVLKTAIDAAHNEYLNILYHQGILGLAAYLLILGATAVKWVRCAPKNTSAAALGSAVLCCCIQAFFGIGVYMTSGIFWVLLGLLERQTTKERKLEYV